MCSYQSQEAAQLCRDKWQLAQVAQESTLGSDFLVLRVKGRGRGGLESWPTRTYNALNNHPPECLVLVSSCYFDLGGILLLLLTNSSLFVITGWALCSTDIYIKYIFSSIRNIGGP